MASPAGGLVQRRKGGGGGGGGGFGDETDEDRYDTSNALNRRGSDLTGSGGRNSLTNNNQDPLNHSSNHGIEQDNDGEDKDGGGGKGRKQNRLTLLDEVFLLGLKDAQVKRKDGRDGRHLSFNFLFFQRDIYPFGTIISHM